MHEVVGAQIGVWATQAGTSQTLAAAPPQLQSLHLTAASRALNCRCLSPLIAVDAPWRAG